MSTSAPQKKQPWKADEESVGCDHCGKEFTLMRRRHHCRRCGEIFCSSCCGEKVKVAGYGDELQRVCIKCREVNTAPADTGGRQSKPKSRQICILGQGSVGKSAIFQQFMDATFPKDYTPTTVIKKTKDVTLNGVDYALTVVDTAGQSSCDLFQPQFSIGTHGFLLVYGIDDRSSFQTVQAIREKIIVWGGHSSCMMLVGNKNDLPTQQRSVTSAEAKALAQSWGVPFHEMSAKKPKAVENVFMDLLQMIENESQN